MIFLILYVADFNHNMNYKKLFDWTKIPVLGLWSYWIWWYIEPDYSNDNFFIDLIQKSINLWYSHIDTAEWYALWHTEELIWKAIKNSSREKLFITSKVSQENLSYEKLILSCENSLKRLKTWYLDLYLIHWYNSNINLSETIKALDYLKNIWKIKNYWVSNFSIENIKEAQKYSNQIFVNQIEYNYFTRDKWQYNDNIEWIVNFCVKNNILIIAYRPLLLWKIPNNITPKFLINWLVSKKWVVTIVWSKNINHLLVNIDYLS